MPSQSNYPFLWDIETFLDFLSKLFFQLGFTPCKAEQPLQGMELPEKEAQKDYSIHEISLERTCT